MISTKKVVVEKIAFAYKTGKSVLHVIEKISLSFNSNTISVIIGPSGCGKTTLLNLIAGVLKPDNGTIKYFEDNQLKEPKIGYVFQTPSLIPWRTVKQNVLLGIEVSGTMTKEKSNEADRLLKAYGLWDFSDAYPSVLSGGMQQRVSVIRAVMSGANILLLDEPFSNTDYILRRELQNDLLHLVSTENLIAIMVTHDLIEAVKLADEIIILSNRPATIVETKKILVPREQRMSSEPTMKNELYKIIEEINKILIGDKKEI